jgi:hypothetical protein
MNITSTQSQTLVAALQPARPPVRAQSPPVPVPPSDGSAAADVVEVSAKVDAGFAMRVLQDSLQERLDAALKEAGIDTSAEELLANGLDTSPEATAKRIVDFSTSFLAAYTANHPKDEASPRLDNFIALIKKAVDEGFGGARDLLSRIGEVPDEVSKGIDQTYDLAMKGIEDFAAKQRQALELAVSGEMPASAI